MGNVRVAPTVGGGVEHHGRCPQRQCAVGGTAVESVLSDQALAQLQNQAGGKTWILKDPLCKDPVTKGPLDMKFCKETPTVMGPASGENAMGSWGRKISIRDWDESNADADAQFRGVVIQPEEGLDTDTVLHL